MALHIRVGGFAKERVPEYALQHQNHMLSPRPPSDGGGPAVQVGTWVGGFGMERMPEEALQHVRSSLRMLIFPGTTILSRRLPAAPIPSDPPPSLWTVRPKPSSRHRKLVVFPRALVIIIRAKAAQHVTLSPSRYIATSPQKCRPIHAVQGCHCPPGSLQRVRKNGT